MQLYLIKGKQNVETFCFRDYNFFIKIRCNSLYKNSSKETCGQYLLFSWKTALTAIMMLGISIVLFAGNSSSELDLIFIYFSS